MMRGVEPTTSVCAGPTQPLQHPCSTADACASVTRLAPHAAVRLQPLIRKVPLAAAVARRVGCKAQRGRVLDDGVAAHAEVQVAAVGGVDAHLRGKRGQDEQCSQEQQTERQKAGKRAVAVRARCQACD